MHNIPHTEKTKQKIRNAIAAIGGNPRKGTGKGRDKEKTRIRQANYIVRYPERRKETAKNSSHKWRMKNLYHLTPERYQEMYEEQGGKCAIPSCPRPIEVIEHDHVAEITRGLTCGKCNFAIGNMDDNPVIAREIADYLERKRN